MAGTTEDGALVAAARAGDRDAVEALYHRHVAAVRRAVGDRVPSADLVEDVIQEAFTRALERLGELRRADRFRPWLLAIARNAANDRWRLDHRQVVLDPEALGDRAPLSPAPDRQATASFLADAVEAGLRRLSGRDATAIRLATHLDLPTTEVARALGVTAGAAKVAVHRARRRLRAVLAVDVLQEGRALACPDHPDVAERDLDACPRCLEATRAHLAGLIAA